ncbi:MAG: TetR family transcriptional regulator [Eikenella sp.]|nr:TetR family transcriptional regulator [Eikenella sp.]
MRKTKIEAQKTRQHLLKAALDTFYVRGMTRSSLNEIAQNAGVTRGALYWHFKNKEDLFEGLFRQVFAAVSADLNHALENHAPDIWRSWEDATVKLFERMETDETIRKFCSILHTKCEYTEQNHTIVKIMRNYQDMWQRQLSDVVSLSMEQKKLPENLDRRAAVIYMMTTVIGLLELWFNMPEQFSIGQMGPRIIRAAMHNLQTAPEFLLPAKKQPVA